MLADHQSKLLCAIVICQAQDSALRAAQAKVHPATKVMHCFAELLFFVCSLLSTSLETFYHFINICLNIHYKTLRWIETASLHGGYRFHDRRISVHRRRHEDDMPKYISIHVALLNQHCMTARNGYGHCYYTPIV